MSLSSEQTYFLTRLLATTLFCVAASSVIAVPFVGFTPLLVVLVAMGAVAVIAKLLLGE